MLLEEVRVIALKRIDDADLALTQCERMLGDKGVSLDKRLSDGIAATPFRKPFEQRQLSQIRKRFNEFSDTIYSAGDDIAALARCREKTRDMGISVVDSAKDKHELHMNLLNAASLREAIGLLRQQLVKYKTNTLRNAATTARTCGTPARARDTDRGCGGA
jgi:hypothetical protein